MKLEQSFEVDLPLDQVWEALVDVERVVPCLPGAVVTGRNDDGSYNGTFTIKIGPTTASYAGVSAVARPNCQETQCIATPPVLSPFSLDREAYLGIRICRPEIKNDSRAML